VKQSATSNTGGYLSQSMADWRRQDQPFLWETAGRVVIPVFAAT